MGNIIKVKTASEEEAPEFNTDAKHRAVILAALSIMEELHQEGLITDEELELIKIKHRA